MANQLDLIDELNNQLTTVEDDFDTYIEWSNEQFQEAEDRISEQNVEIQILEEAQNDMRILGYAMAIAFIRQGLPWRRIHATMQEPYLAEARQTLQVIDAN